MAKKTARQYVLCVKNDGFPASLEVHKVYQAIPDPEAARHRMVRVIDESGEDYLYSARYFVGVDLPAAVKRTFSKQSGRRVSA